MYTSILTLSAALVSWPLMPATPQSPTWLNDYAVARTQVKERGKPIAVFFGSGKDGWNQLCSGGSLGKDTTQLLAEKYLCVYVDLAKPDAKRLGATFEISDANALIVSDRSGGVQAFRHEGKLTDEDLLRYLKRYADPERVVRTTETTAVERVSNYAPPAQQYYQPFYQSFSSGRSC